VPWVTLAAAIGLEILATSFISTTDGFTRPWPTVGVLLTYAASFLMLSQTVKQLEVGVVYAIWSGVGTAVIATIGVVFLHETVSAGKVVSLALIIVGVVMLNLSTSHA
jgi:small multidrug resistance pump